MNDPADHWDSPLDREPPGKPSAFFDALAKIDDGTPPEWMPTAAGIAALVERYLADAADTDQRAAIVNLASLLRHASAFAASLCREIEHYAAEARDAKAEVAELREQLDGLCRRSSVI